MSTIFEFVDEGIRSVYKRFRPLAKRLNLHSRLTRSYVKLAYRFAPKTGEITAGDISLSVHTKTESEISVIHGRNGRDYEHPARKRLVETLQKVMYSSTLVRV